MSTESLPPPKRTRTEKKTGRGAETKAETDGAREVKERAAKAAAAAAVRGASAHREKARLTASAGGRRERNLSHHSSVPEILSRRHALTGRKMTVAMPVRGIPSGSLHLQPRLTERPIAPREATALFGRVRGGTGRSEAVILMTHPFQPHPTNITNGPTTESI